MPVNSILKDERLDFVSPCNMAFLSAFDGEMERLGYFCGSVGPGYCWGRYMLIYTKKGVKSKKCYARIYIRDSSVALRMYFSNIDLHRANIESAPEYVQRAFTGVHPTCRRCEGRSECRHRKRYTLHGKAYEVCDGLAFEFFDPDVSRLPDYLQLFTAFYPQNPRAGRQTPSLF